MSGLLVGLDGKPLPNGELKARTDDMISVPVALFEAMHQKMFELEVFEEAVEVGLIDSLVVLKEIVHGLRAPPPPPSDDTEPPSDTEPTNE